MDRPVGDMIDEMLFEHEAPSLDDVEQRLFEGFGVHAEPIVEDLHAFYRLRFLVDLFVRVDLKSSILLYSSVLVLFSDGKSNKVFESSPIALHTCTHAHTHTHTLHTHTHTNTHSHTYTRTHMSAHSHA